ncbi:MAG: extracellular solute-binding protein [Deltaproteobacteria bacterium]|nr:extracellular solute-binding protein [Deltaproteobacteria bacterium]MDZ4345603.1 extracellular solute-binding protein [Candidatus Binatia bacterium]
MNRFKTLTAMSVAVWFFAQLMGAALSAESLDELHKKALKEGGTLNFYGTLAQINAARILPVFEKKFPGIKINHVDATSDKLVARAVTEARGGRTLGDVLQIPLENVVQAHDQKLLLETKLPESAEYPDGAKGSFWTASDLQFFVAAWNTNLVKKEEEPKSFDDFADPKWKNRLIAEPRDLEMLLAFAKYKFKSDEKAIAFWKRVALNNVEFHKGHSQLAELLVAGQAAVCITCYSHHYPTRIKKGAPLNYMLTEGVASINGTAIFKDAPHPNTAMLFARWIASLEGQKAMAQGGRTPAHPKVEPVDKTRTEKIYFVSADDLKEFPKYEKIWKEIFRLR